MAKKSKKAPKSKSDKNLKNKSKKHDSKNPSDSCDFFGWSKLIGWLDRASVGSSRKKFKATCYFLGNGSDWQSWKQELKGSLNSWQLAQFGESKEVWRFETEEGRLWVVKPRQNAEQNDPWQPSRYAQARDLAGRWFHDLDNLGEESVRVIVDSDDEREIEGWLVGLDLSAYTYRKLTHSISYPSSALQFQGITDQQLNSAKIIARSVNTARHLVNTPPNLLNPVSYADGVAELFKPFKSVTVDCWDEKRIHKAGMQLLEAVGQAATQPPRLLHLRYRPDHGQGKQKKAPIALVGKGITFDSGGLDIKPPAGMRLMKKDMGGSACLVGLLYWLVLEAIDQPVDVYLPMAENAIAGNAFRPGDIYKSYNGRTVEIHNTDAEGRLILADALSLACEAKDADRPSQVLCVATLTGAAKIALGADITAYFTNQSELHKSLVDAGKEYGDLLWELPLFPAYKSLLKSVTADVCHCASTPFAGSITAALFLSEFVDRDLPFAHFDIYAWNDKPKGALREAGGSGQIVQALIGYLRSLQE